LLDIAQKVYELPKEKVRSKVGAKTYLEISLIPEIMEYINNN
jgi:hypothetical protein